MLWQILRQQGLPILSKTHLAIVVKINMTIEAKSNRRKEGSERTLKIIYSPSARVAFNYIADAAGADAKNGIYASYNRPRQDVGYGEDWLCAPP